MSFGTSANPGTFQVNPDDLLSTYPQFHAAGDAIRGTANSLKDAVTKAISSFDGDTHKNLQMLGNDCVKNLQDLAGAMDEIATRLHQSALSINNTENQNTHSFK